MADWVKLSHDEQTVFYIESKASKRDGDHVMIATLRDYAAARVDRARPYRSTRDEFEVDCGAKRIRRGYTADHAQGMGKGAVVHSEYGPLSWNFAPPNTVLRRIVDVACAQG